MLFLQVKDKDFLRQNLRDFITTKPMSQEMLKGVLQAEAKRS